jgi:hypothetical protein
MKEAAIASILGVANPIVETRTLLRGDATYVKTRRGIHSRRASKGQAPSFKGTAAWGVAGARHCEACA